MVTQQVAGLATTLMRGQNGRTRWFIHSGSGRRKWPGVTRCWVGSPWPAWDTAAAGQHLAATAGFRDGDCLTDLAEHARIIGHLDAAESHATEAIIGARGA